MSGYLGDQVEILVAIEFKHKNNNTTTIMTIMEKHRLFLYKVYLVIKKDLILNNDKLFKQLIQILNILLN